jgi:hypothetical protein
MLFSVASLMEFVFLRRSNQSAAENLPRAATQSGSFT